METPMGRRGPQSRIDPGKLRKWFESGLSVQEVARRLKCARSSIYHQAEVHGIPTPPPRSRVNQRNRAKWAKAIAKSRTLAEAGERMGATRQAASEMAGKIRDEGGDDES